MLVRLIHLLLHKKLQKPKELRQPNPNWHSEVKYLLTSCRSLQHQQARARLFDCLHFCSISAFFSSFFSSSSSSSSATLTLRIGGVNSWNRAGTAATAAALPAVATKACERRWKVVLVLGIAWGAPQEPPQNRNRSHPEKTGKEVTYGNMTNLP